jgi:TolA-binding protein
MDFTEQDKSELVKRTRLLKQLDHMNSTINFLEEMLHIMAEMVETQNTNLAHYQEERDENGSRKISETDV